MLLLAHKNWCFAPVLQKNTESFTVFYTIKEALEISLIKFKQALKTKLFKLLIFRENKWCKKQIIPPNPHSKGEV